MNESREPMSLASVLAKVEQGGFIDDDAARKRSAYGENMQAAVARAKRRDHLVRGGALGALEPEIRKAIVCGELKPVGKSMQIVQRWLANPFAHACVAIQGGTGCGKSVASAWAIAELGGILRSAQQVVRAFASRALDAVADQEAMLRCPLLVLDDLGTEHARDREWMTLALRELLECRQAQRTLITTNLTLAQALDMYSDERIASRATRIAWLADGGPDLRKAKP